MSAALELGRETAVDVTALEALRRSGRPRPDERGDWLLVLRDHIHGCPDPFSAPDRTDQRGRLLDLALRCDDWPLAARLGEAIAAHDGPDAATRLALAVSLWHLGRLAEAGDCCRQMLLEQPWNARAETLYAELCHWSNFLSAIPAWDPALADDGTVYLEPLGHHHVSDFAWQYHDPTIAELCCMPAFADDGEWHDWLDDSHAFGDQLIFGVWHREWGLVGSVSLLLIGDIGFFYYWVGRDFRGEGLGPRAGALLLRLAEHAWGMRACYAKAFRENRASRSGLRKMGFRRLDVPIAREDAHAEDLFRHPAPATDVTEEARSFLAAMGGATRVSRPVGAGHWGRT